MDVDLSVIVVSHHHEEFLEGCFSSLLEHVSGITAEIILVDNVASPELKIMMAEKFPMVKLIANDSPMGFAANCNKGFRESVGRHVLLLNPDIKIAEGDFGDLIRQMNEISNVGAVCGQLLNPDLTAQSHFRRFPTLPAILFRGFNLKRFFPKSSIYKNYMMEDADHSKKMEIDWCLGAFLMLKRERYEAIGLMDENFIMYYEDIDLCYRLKMAGYKNWFIPGVQAIHYYQRTSAKRLFSKLKFIHAKSILYFFWKHKFILSAPRPPRLSTC